MTIIPLFKVRDLRAAIKHYTEILDFDLVHPYDEGDFGADLINGDALFQLTTIENDQLFGSVANVQVEDVDSLFSKYKERGLDTSHKKQSPVHQGPTDQTWGTREFYVTDADGNTLRFFQR